MNRSESITNLATALNAFQAAVEGAKKTSDNPYYKSKYADLASIWQTIREPLTANGLSVAQVSVPTEPGMIGIETMLAHTSGEWISGTITLMLAKNDPQSAGSAITYARRYGLAAILGVHQEDDDANTHLAGKKKPVEDAHKLRLEISALVMELKDIAYDGYDKDIRRKNSYKKHLGSENPNDCQDSAKLTAYLDHLKELREQAITEATLAKKAKAEATNE